MLADMWKDIRHGSGMLVKMIVAPLLSSMTLLANYVPARRAARLDPLAALRQD